MANLNTDLISPEQAMEEAIILHKSRDAVANIEGMFSNGSEIDKSVNNKYDFILGEDLYDLSTEKFFLDASNWSPQLNGGTSPIFDNVSTFHKFNTLSLRVGDTTSGDTSLFGKRADLTNAVDLSNSDLVSFWVYVDGDLVSDLSSASSYGSVLFIAGSLNFTNAKGANILGVAGGSWHKGWNNITVLKSEFTINIAGSFDWSDAQSFQIRIDTASGNIGTLLHFDSIFLGVDNNYKIPVCITLDDSTKDTYEMTKIMNKYGIKVSNFVIPDFIDNHNIYPNYMTLEMCKNLYNQGNHIGMHHQDVNAFALNKESILDVSNWLKDNGFTRNEGHLYGSYPNGSYNQESINYAKEIGIKGLRSLTGINRDDSQGREATTGLIHYEALANGGIADVYRINSTKPTSVSDLTSKLNLAIEKRAGFLTYHHIFSEFTNRAQWEALAVYLRSLVDDGIIECLTFPQFCKKYSN